MGGSVIVRVVEPWQAPTLAGELVRLEPLSVAHREGLWAASRDASAWRWLPISQPASREGLDAWLDEALAGATAGTELPLVTLALRPTPGSSLPRGADGAAVVGSTRFLALRPAHRSVEIGWTWLHPEVWGRGVNVEAKLLMLAHAFEAWGCRRVELKTDALNERSRAAIEALGATFEGIHRKHMLVRGGENRDTAWYSILDDEWPDVREHLTALLDRRLSPRESRQTG